MENRLVEYGDYLLKRSEAESNPILAGMAVYFYTFARVKAKAIEALERSQKWRKPFYAELVYRELFEKHFANIAAAAIDAIDYDPTKRHVQALEEQLRNRGMMPTREEFAIRAKDRILDARTKTARKRFGKKPWTKDLDAISAIETSAAEMAKVTKMGDVHAFRNQLAESLERLGVPQAEREMVANHFSAIDARAGTIHPFTASRMLAAHMHRQEMRKLRPQ